MDTDRFDWIKDIPAWGTFLGTISISFLAMFSNRLKNWFCRPKLSCEIDNTRKFCGIIDDDSDVDKVDSGISQSDFVWCLKVSNKGKQVADNCRVQCDRIYEENDGGGSFTLKREFISQGFYWSTGDKKEDVVKGKPSWCRIFILSKMPEQGKESARDNKSAIAKPSLHLYLGVERSVKGCYVLLRNKGMNTFLIPLMIHYDNAPSGICQWLKVHWTDGSSSPCSTNFTIEMLSEKRAMACIGKSHGE